MSDLPIDVYLTRAAQAAYSLMHEDVPDMHVRKPLDWFGQFADAIKVLREFHDQVAKLSGKTGKLYDPWTDARTVWEGLRASDDGSKQYGLLDREIRRIGDQLVDVPPPPKPWETTNGTRPVEYTATPTMPIDSDDLPLLLPATELHRIPPAIPLIPGVLYVNTLHQFFGPPGCGKSFLMADIACIVAQRYRVIYIAAEAIEDYPARIDAWTAHYGRSAENLYFWREPLHLSSDGAIQRFLAHAADVRPAFIALDPLADCMNGLDESGAGDMSIAIASLNTIRRATRAAIGIVHHTGWNDERERGSSLLRAACRVVSKIEMRDDGLIRLACIKKNQGEKFAPRLFRLVSAGTQGSVLPLPASLVLTGKSKPNDRMLRVMEALTTDPLRGGATHTQLKDDTQISPGTLNRVLTSLVDAQLVEAFEDRRSRKYQLTAAGYEHLRTIGESSSKILEEGGGSSTGFGRTSFNWFLCSSDQTGLEEAPSSTSFQSSSSPEVPSSTFSGPYIRTRVEEPGSVEAEEVPVTAELFTTDTPDSLTPAEWTPTPESQAMIERLTRRKDAARGNEPD